MSQTSLATWRKNLLGNHTLVAAITMPYDLFYPTGANVSVIILKAHVPHSGKVWFCRIDNDGFKIKRKKRMECEGEQLSRALKLFKSREFDAESQEIPSFSCYCELDPDDELAEFSPEYYLASPEYDSEVIQESVEQLLKDFAAFNIKYSTQLKNIKRSDNENN